MINLKIEIALLYITKKGLLQYITIQLIVYSKISLKTKHTHTHTRKKQTKSTLKRSKICINASDFFDLVLPFFIFFFFFFLLIIYFWKFFFRIFKYQKSNTKTKRTKPYIPLYTVPTPPPPTLSEKRLFLSNFIYTFFASGNFSSVRDHLF